jgi:pyruvate/2-oxoglutarate dehydrogenase complex dihydrolipoamide dehydrogenase (E3) component
MKETMSSTTSSRVSNRMELSVFNTYLDPPIPHAVFTNPQIGGVGLTEPQAIAKHGNVVIGRCNYKNVAMGDALRSTHGFCKLIFAEDTKKLVGAHIIGAEGAITNSSQQHDSYMHCLHEDGRDSR